MRQGLRKRLRRSPRRMLKLTVRNLSASRYQYAEDALRRILPQITPRVVYDIGAGEAPMRGRVGALDLTWIGLDAAPRAPDVVRWNIEDPVPAGVPRPGAILL